MHAQLGQIMNNKIQKDQNPTATSEELGAKQGIGHALITTKGVGRPPKPLLQLDLWTRPLPSSRIRNQLVPFPPPHQGDSKGTCCLFSLPHAAARIPVKPCLSFSSGLLSVSIKEAKNPGP